MDDKKFLEICQAENEKLALITEKEVVSDELAFKALIIVYNMALNDVGDVLLFASALNILNTYVKQSSECKDAVSYAFKDQVDEILRYLARNPNENIICEIQEDNDTNMCIMSIFSIQFSFHCIKVTEENDCFLVLDSSKQRLHFDGIRKHSCSCTLHAFADENTYGRSNKMLDGSDFIAEMDKLVDEFRSGTKKMWDARFPMYLPKNGDGQEISASALIEKIYSASNRYLISLSTCSEEQFQKEVQNRQIISKIIASYAEQTGRSFGEQTLSEIKYALEYFSNVLIEADANPDSSICLLFNRIPYHESLEVLVCSKDNNGTKRATTFELMNWSIMKLRENGNVDIFDTSTRMYAEVIHPSLVNKDMNTIKNSGYFQENIDWRNCILFFDAEKTKDNDIISGLPEDTEINSTYYASDREAILEEVKYTASFSDGDDVVFEIISSLDRLFNASSGEITSEHEYVIERAVQMAMGKNSNLYIISYRKFPGNTEFLDRLLQRYSQSDIKVSVFSDLLELPEKANTHVAVFNDVIPAEAVLDKYHQVVVLCDLYDPNNTGKDGLLKKAAYERYCKVESSLITSAVGYSDGGAGSGWILKNLNICNIALQNMQQDKYPIIITDSQDDIAADENVKTVIVPKSFKYDDEKLCVVSSKKDRKSLYSKISSADSGVCLVVSDEGLYRYLMSQRENSEDIKLDEYIDANEDEIRKKLDIVSSLKATCAPNSEIYNHYLTVAISHIHQDAWEKMHDDSKDWVISALSHYYNMSSTDINMDYSGPVLLLSKTFENEMVSRISIEYAAYLENRYGSKYVDHLPDGLLQKNGDGFSPVDPEKISLGNLPYIMGMNTKGHLNSQKDLDEFLQYCNDKLAASMDNIMEYIQKLCEIIYVVRCKYRNKAAHTSAITYEDATDCVEYSIINDRMLGVVMDFFRQ